MNVATKSEVRVVAKSSIRQEGSSHCEVIPQTSPRVFGPKSGEYFVMKAEPAERKMTWS